MPSTAATSRSAYGTVVTVWVGACRRNSSSQARAATAWSDGSEAEPTSPPPVLLSVGDGEVEEDGDGVGDPLGLSLDPSGPGSILGLSSDTERAASRTAGSTTQVIGEVARPDRFSSRSRRPSAPRARLQAPNPSSRPAAPRRTSALTGTTSASRVDGVLRGTCGMKVRARPSAMVSRPVLCEAPRTCTPIQYTPASGPMPSRDRGTETR